MKTMGHKLQTRLISALLVFVMVFAAIVSAGLVLDVEFGDIFNALGFGKGNNSVTNLNSTINTTNMNCEFFLTPNGNWGYEITKTSGLVLDGKRDEAYDTSGITLKGSYARSTVHPNDNFTVSFAADGQNLYVLYEIKRSVPLVYCGTARHRTDNIDFVFRGDGVEAGDGSNEFRILGYKEGGSWEEGADTWGDALTKGVSAYYVKHTGTSHEDESKPETGDYSYNIEFTIPLDKITGTYNGNRAFTFTAKVTYPNTTELTPDSSYGGADTVAGATYTIAEKAVNKDAQPSMIAIKDPYDEMLSDGRYLYYLTESNTELNGTDGLRDAAYNNGLVFPGAYMDYNVGKVQIADPNNNYVVYIAADSKNAYILYEFTKSEGKIYSGGPAYYHNDCAELLYTIDGKAKYAHDVRIWGEAEGTNHYETKHAEWETENIAVPDRDYDAPYANSLNDKGVYDNGIGAINTAKSSGGLKSYTVKHTDKGYNVEFVIDRSVLAGKNMFSFLGVSTIAISDTSRSYGFTANGANVASNAAKEKLNVVQIVSGTTPAEDEISYTNPDYVLNAGTRYGYYITEANGSFVTDGYRDEYYKSGLKFKNEYLRSTTVDPNNTYDLYIGADDERVSMLWEFTDSNIIVDGHNVINGENVDFFPYYNDAAQFCFTKDGRSDGSASNTQKVIDYGTGSRCGTVDVDGVKMTYIVVKTEKGFNVEVSFPRASILNENTFGFLGLSTIAADSTNRDYGHMANAIASPWDEVKKYVSLFQIVDYDQKGDSTYDEILNDAGSGTEARWKFYLEQANTAILNDGYKDPAYSEGLKFSGKYCGAPQYLQTGNKYDVYLAADETTMNFLFEFVDPQLTFKDASPHHVDGLHFRLGEDGKNVVVDNNANICLTGGERIKQTWNTTDGMTYTYSVVYTDVGYNIEISVPRKFLKDNDTFSFVGIATMLWYDGNTKKQTYCYTDSTYGKTGDPSWQKYANQFEIVDRIPTIETADVSEIYTNITVPTASGATSTLINDTILANANAVVVYPKETTEAVKATATAVAKVVKDAITAKNSVNVEVPVLEEGNEEISNYTNKIIVGHVLSYAETAEAVAELSYAKGGVRVSGNNVSIIAPTEQTLDYAAKIFEKVITGATGYTTAYSLYWFESPAVAGYKVPVLDNARMVNDNGFGSYQILTGAATREDYDAYCDKLIAAGYRYYAFNYMGGKYTSKTFYNNTEIVTVNFGKHYAQYFDLADSSTVEFTTENMNDLIDSIRVNVTSRAIYSLPVMETGDYEAKAETAFIQVGQSADGLCDIVRLEDGRFIIFDSKQNWSYYRIYETLLSLTGGEKPVVAAWFFTHFHQDHNGGFCEFMKQEKENVKNLIEIQNVIVNLGSAQVYGTSYSVSSTDKANMEAFTQYLEYSGANLIFGVAGQQFTFANATVEILLTYSDSMPMNIASDNTNRTGSIFSLSICGEKGTGKETEHIIQKFMITGDSAAEQHNLANLRYGDYLKSDFLQLSHHGGGEYRNHDNTAGTGAGYLASYNFYKTVDPTHILIPGTNGNASGTAEKAITSEVKAKSGSKVFYVDKLLNGGTTTTLKIYSNAVISIPYGNSELTFPTLPIDPVEYTNTTTGTLNSDSLNCGENPNDVITAPYGITENGSYLYVGKTAYVNDIPVDGVMEDIYTYGIHLKNDRGANGGAAVQSSYDIYMVFDQNGKLHVFYDIYDPNWHVYKNMANGYRQDGIDFYFGFGTPGTVESNSFRIKAVVEEGANTIEVQNAYNVSGGKRLDVLEKFAVVVESNDPNYATPTKGQAVHYTVEFVFNHVFTEGELFSFWAGAQNLKAVIPAEEDKDVQTNGHDNMMTDTMLSSERSAYVNPTDGRNNVIVVSKAPATDLSDDHAHDFVKETDEAPIVSEILPNQDIMTNKISGIGKVYTIPATDGQWDNIYSYGYKISGDYSTKGNPNDGGFDAYLVYAADGKIHVFIKVIDNTKDEENGSGYIDYDEYYYHGDSVDVFVNNKYSTTGRTQYAFQARTDSQNTNGQKQPADYKVVMTEEGYNIEFSFDNNGSPYRIGDVFTFDIYMNDVDLSNGYKKSSITNGTYWMSDTYKAVDAYFAPEYRYSDGIKIISGAPIAVDKCVEHTFGDDSICDLCGDTCKHNYTSETTDATCTVAGKTVYTCTDCGHSYEEVTSPATGHAYGAATYKWSEDNKTCTATRVCGNDGTHTETETVEATSETTDATCTEDGFTVYTATFTNEAFAVQTKEVAIPATGHAYGDDHICDTCGAVCEHEYDGKYCVYCDREKPRFTSRYLTLKDDIAIKYELKDSLLNNGYVFSKVVFTSANEQVPDLTYDTLPALNGEGIYTFAFGMPPYAMGDDVTVTLYVTYNGGEEIAIDTLTYTVKQYCDNQLASNTISSELKTLLIELLNYGAAAQKYVDQDVEDDALLNAGISADDQAEIEAKRNTTFDDVQTAVDKEDVSARLASISVTLREGIWYNFEFVVLDSEINVEDISIKITVEGGATYTISEFNETSTPDRYQFTFKGVRPHQLRNVISVDIYNGDELISGDTFSTSIESYASRQSNSVANEESLRELIKMMMYYGDAAAAYESNN